MKLILVLTHIALVVGLNADSTAKPALSNPGSMDSQNLLSQPNPTDVNPVQNNLTEPAAKPGLDLKKIDSKLNKEMGKKATKAELRETYNQFLAMENSPGGKANMDEMMEKLAGITPGSEDSMIDPKNVTKDPVMTVTPTQPKKDRELDVKNTNAPDTYNNSVYASTSKTNAVDPNNPGMMSPIFNQPPLENNMPQQTFNPRPSPQLNLVNAPMNAYPYNRQLGMGSFSAPDIESGDPLMGSFGNEHITGPSSDMQDMKNSYDDSMSGTPASLDDSYGSNDHLNQGMHAAETQAMIDSMDQMNKQKMADMDHKMALEDLANNAEPGEEPGSLKKHRKKQSIASLLKDYPPELVQQFMPELKRRVMRKVHAIDERKRRNRKLRRIRNRIKREKRRERRRKLRLRRKHHHHHNPRHHHHHHHYNAPHYNRNYQNHRNKIHFHPMTVKKHDKRSKHGAIKILKNFVHKHSRYRHWARNLQDLPEMEDNDRNEIHQRNLEGSNPSNYFLI